MQNKNRSLIRGLLIALVALMPLAAITQTPPPDDDDGFFLPALIEAIRPACTAIVASPISVQTQSNFTLTATCTKIPTTYEWKLDTVVIATTATATLPLVAPSTPGPATYSVRAGKNNIWSAPASTNVTVTAPPLGITVTAPATSTRGSPITFSGTVTGGSGNSTVFLTNDGVSLGLATPTNGAYSISWTPSQIGVYVVKALVGSAAAYATVLVTEAPAAQALAIPGTSNAGAIAGSFNVSDSGAAAYSIPISVPPGIAGMQPSLALSYNSQSGNGHLGVGWALSGLSAITRCPKTIAQDGAKAGVNYDNDITNDAFCLDGQRLISVGTPAAGTDAEFGAITITQYRTEIDRFDRIESYQQNSASVILGPMNFKVYTKAGQILQYGLRWWAKNSGFGQGTAGNTIKVWPLDRVADRNGNYYVIDYAGSQSTGSAPIRQPLVASATSGPTTQGAYAGTELYPVQITYTMNQSQETAITQVNRVVLEYENRPPSDRHVIFDAGAGQALISKRLKSLKTYVDGTRQLFTTQQGIVLDYPYVVCNTGSGHHVRQPCEAL